MALRFNLGLNVNVSAANIITLHIHIIDLSVHLGAVCLSKHCAIVAALTIVPNGPMLYSGSQWMALQPLISLFTSWTAHSQTERQRQWLLGSVVGYTLCVSYHCPPKALLKSHREVPACDDNMGLLNNLDKDAVTPSICLHFEEIKASCFHLRWGSYRGHLACSVQSRPRSQFPHCHGN